MRDVMVRYSLDRGPLEGRICIELPDFKTIQKPRICRGTTCVPVTHVAGCFDCFKQTLAAESCPSYA